RDPRVSVTEDTARGCAGPIWVEGGITVEAADGTVYEERNRVTLCRCGQSQNKPYCDGTHASINFTDKD
ncbi:MAG: CDGSH iron-sulfur domain-containing protein, partial [Sphingomonadaceae bacterium]